MAWTLTARMIESCSCNMLCPCWFGVQELMMMDRGWCAGAMAFLVQQGRSDGVDLSGRNVVWAFDFPGPTLFDGNATARLYIDAAASADQRRELEAIFQGQKGGPMEALRDLIAKWLPTRSAEVQVREQGDTITVTVGDAGELRSQLMRDPQGRAMTLRGGGFVADYHMEALELAPSSTRWTDPEMRSVETRSGGRGTFTWSG